MGLDMYLKARVSTWNMGEEAAEALNALKPFLHNREIMQVVIEVAYWRKFNALHKWFVDHVQGGKDECEPHEVSEVQLRELLDLLRRVRDTEDASLLPPASGFFFGSTEVDEWYWQDVNETIHILEEVLQWEGLQFMSLTYCSSW